MIRDVNPVSGSWFFTHPGSRIQGSKRHRIPDLDPQHWPLPTAKTKERKKTKRERKGWWPRFCYVSWGEGGGAHSDERASLITVLWIRIRDSGFRMDRNLDPGLAFLHAHVLTLLRRVNKRTVVHIGIDLVQSRSTCNKTKKKFITKPCHNELVSVHSNLARRLIWEPLPTVQ